MWKEKK
jgi:hypothetical protein